MTIRELIKLAEEYKFMDDEVADVLQFETNRDRIDMKRGVCGMCSNRKTDVCPFPTQCGLTFPICLTFKKKE